MMVPFISENAQYALGFGLLAVGCCFVVAWALWTMFEESDR